jgi:hypothetical protein
METARRIALRLALLILVPCSPATLAQENPSSPAWRTTTRSDGTGGAVHAPTFGTKDRIQYHVGYAEFSPDASTTPYATGGPAILGPSGRYSVGTYGFFTAHPRLPSGALLQSFELDYCDNSVANVVLSLVDCDFMADNCNSLGQLSSSDGSSGCSFLVADISSFKYTMENNSRQLLLGAFTGAGDTSTVLLGAYIGYKLQVSPAPATATFGDVPTSHPFFRAIEALSAAGVTSGCGGGNFCPDQSVTRGEIAKFLANALGLHFPN